MGNCNCAKREPSYARYDSHLKDTEVDLENVVGSILEMDPCLQDREEGVAKINSWIEEILPEINTSRDNMEISRWKCIKYWEAQHVSDVYGAEYSTVGTKLTGSCVRFYFEKRQLGEVPRLVIEHCGKSVHVKDKNDKNWSFSIPEWLSFRKTRNFFKWKRISKRNLDESTSLGSLSDLHGRLS